MGILEGDIRLFKSEVLLDTPDGGGKMTGNEVIDGESNNLFPDIAELDRVYGRIALRKAFLAVVTDDTDSYYGSHVIIDRPPKDLLVAASIFTTKSWDDRRTDAQNRVESYLTRGIKWIGQLLERQLVGQRAIAMLLKPGDPTPDVGQSLVLVQDEGKASEIEQYIRVTKVTTEEREFRTTEGTWIGMICTCEISDPLRYDFIGPPPSPFDDVAAQAVVRDTMVADAAQYYGIKPTTAEAQLGDMRVQVESIYGQLIPSAQSETALVDLTAAGEATPVIDSSTGEISFTTAATIGAALNLHLGNGCLPGTLQIVLSGGEITDDGGQLISGGIVVGTIDYGRGLLTFGSASPTYGGTKTVRFHPAAQPTRVANTYSIPVPPEGRGYVYTATLVPTPMPGSTMVSFMAQGKWYDLRDDGSGALRGADSAYGSGTINYETGTVIVTTGALPDANTEVLFAWGVNSSYFNRSGTTVKSPSIKHTTANAGVSPNSLTVTWTDGANTKTATDDGKGNIIGDATGTIHYARGEIILTPNILPAGGAQYTIEYSYGNPIEERFDAPFVNALGLVDLTLSNSNILPGSIEAEYNMTIVDRTGLPPEYDIAQPYATIARVHDKDGEFDGDGVGWTLIGAAGAHTINRGTIDYANGTIEMEPAAFAAVPIAAYGSGSATLLAWMYYLLYAALPTDGSGYIIVRYRSSGAENTATETVSTTNLAIDLTDQYAEAIISGSVRFRLGGKTYIDRLGSLYCDVDASNGSGTLAGSVSYASGEAIITSWQPSGTSTVTLDSLLTELSGQPVPEVYFRVPGAPIRAGSFQIRMSPITGGTVYATANADGSILTDDMSGSIDVQTGIVTLQFGKLVPAAGNEGEFWYDANKVDLNGNIFKPAPVYADTIRYNAVVQTYIPLSADILGLDPVRLPQDGRVPIYRIGDVVVLHNTQSEAFPNPVSAGYTLDVGRVRLSLLKVFDADNKELPDDQYTVDLDAGIVTLATPLDLSGFVQPLRAEHRVEDMGLISDVQINGVLSVTRSITHDYPVGSYVSSALIVGDLQSRQHTMFSQQTWTGSWSDERQGNEILAQYNNTLYPVAVTNRGSIEERWAMIFTSATEFRVVGETVGQIATGNINTDLMPINPEMEVPYFELKALGWGSGWATGNVLRFNTAGANYPLWLARTVLQGQATEDHDSFRVQIRGDVDR